ncbi:MAG: hypothetical protein RL685_4446 [Pseudomonadota bacterium]|jgi:hypothetical protein
MAVTVASFKVAFPEFLRAEDPMLEAQLAMAELEVSDAFEESRDLAVMLRLADNLALSPWGRDARLVGTRATSSTYGERFARMAEANGVSPSRLGSAVRSADVCP